VAKLIISAIVALLLLIFSSQNLNPVWVRFVTGPAVQLPVIVVIVGAFLAGYLVATFNQIMRVAPKRKKADDDEEEE
jgi:uncharacterized integral membrane protein